jgi:Ca2+-binding RTX toxin-like protein
MRTSASKTALGLTTLESREVPATFANGVLTINASESPVVGGSRMVTVRVVSQSPNGQFVKVDGQAINGAEVWLRPKDVTGVVVIGSPQKDRISVQAVEGKYGFHDLDGRVEVSGGGGNDVIYGTAFADRLSGGAGDDIIKGGPGSDVIRGGSGDDDLYGSGDGNTHPTDGNDAVYGEGDNDTLHGGGGNDILVGGPGVDVFLGGGPGDDTVYFDGQDKKPVHGWKGYGFEHAYAGNPKPPAFVAPFKTVGHRSADGWLDPMPVV